MPSSFGSSGGGVAAFLQRQQQPSVYDMGMPPPMSREAKRRKSINATPTSPTEAADFGLDLDLSSGRSTPLRSNSSGLASSANRTSTAANPFAVDLDLDASADVLAEDLLRRTCLP